MKEFVSWELIEECVTEIAFHLKDTGKEFTGVFGVPRGGSLLAVMLSHKLDLPYIENPYDVLEDGTLAIIGDSLVDFISNASTLAGGEPWPARANSSVIWDKQGGTNRVGNHSIYVEIDPDNEIEEWNDEDNNMTFTLEVLESKADLIVSNIFIDDNNPVRGIPSDIVIK